MDFSAKRLAESGKERVVEVIITTHVFVNSLVAIQTTTNSMALGRSVMAVYGEMDAAVVHVEQEITAVIVTEIMEEDDSSSDFNVRATNR